MPQQICLHMGDQLNNSLLELIELTLRSKVDHDLLAFLKSEGFNLSKIDIVQQIIKNPSREILESILHDDFFLVREEGLETREEFIDYVFAHDEVGNDLHIEMLEIECLYEDENSLVWQDIFKSSLQGKTFTTKTYVTYKDGKWWRAIMNKFEV